MNLIKRSGSGVLIFSLIIFYNAVYQSFTIAQEIKIGLHPDKRISSVVFSVVEGNYRIISAGNIVLNTRPGDIFYLSVENNMIQFTGGNRKYSDIRTVVIEKTTTEGILQLKPVLPLLQSADYDGNLSIGITDGHLMIINQVDLDHYIAGVIEAEGGSNAYPEYYKAQAILIRTYALRNMLRHTGEGYNLCSSEHCQAYRGKSLLNRQIYEATHTTDNLVIKDIRGNLAITPYHSNCGGSTSTADMAWQTHHYYLQPVSDMFCSKGKNYQWTKTITLSKWEKYLSDYGVNTNRLSAEDYLVKSNNRQKYIRIKEIYIPTRNIREDFKLKSSFFSIEKKGNEIIFTGKGFGHGVGLCQEGAMEMARVGYTYVDILHYYFQHVKIEPLGGYKKVEKEGE